MWFHLLLTLALLAGDGDLTEDFEGAGSESWERLRSDAHPPYNVIERAHDPGRAKSGSQFLHFRTLGGSTGVRRSAKLPLAVESGRPYRASVHVRLSGNKRNQASLSLTWVNGAGDVVAEQRSRPVDGSAGWTWTVLDVAAPPAGATGVLPGLHYDGTDIRGTCDFDLLAFGPTQLLDVRPAGRSIANFGPEEYPRFTLAPAGLPPGVYSITATLEAGGRSVQRTVTLDYPAVRSVAVDFPPTAPGIYSLTASIDQQEASRRMAVLVASPGQPLDQVPVDPSALGTRWIRGAERVDAHGAPTADYYALRIVDHLLAGTEPLADPGLFPAGVQVAAFRKGSSVGVALWTGTGELRVPVSLNEGAVVHPLAGAPRPHRPGEELAIGVLPTFILGVEPLLTELGLELSAGELPLQLNPTRLTLRLRNRSRAGVPKDIQVALEGLPAGWRASARRFKIASLPPAAVHEETLDLIVPPSESERPVDLTFDLGFTVGGKEVSLRLQRRLALKSALRIEAVRTGKTLSVRVANASDRPMTLSIRSRVPGLAERLDLVRDLAPGTRTKALEFPILQDGSAEFVVQESGGDRALARLLLP